MYIVVALSWFKLHTIAVVIPTRSTVLPSERGGENNNNETHLTPPPLFHLAQWREYSAANEPPRGTERIQIILRDICPLYRHTQFPAAPA